MKKVEKSEGLAEISISYSVKSKSSNRPRITTSKEAVDIFRDLWGDGTIELRESMYVLLLNRANHVIGWFKHSVGGISGTIGDPRLIFSIALKCLAPSIILAHNHPSGNVQPSASDIQLTKNLVEGGKFLEITVLDHIILSVDSFFSFADEGLV